MKNLSIRTRVTSWYVTFLLLVVVLFFAVIMYISNYLIQQDIKDDLSRVVNDNISNITIKDDALNIDKHMIFYRDHTSLLVYKENNFIIAGVLPDEIKNPIPFVPNQVRKIEDSNKKFYVYDVLIHAPDFEDVWIRGIRTAELAELYPSSVFIMKFFFLALLPLMALALLGGHLITKRSFEPVSRIIQTAHEIEKEKDFTRRTKLQLKTKSKDEVYELANAFDNMLNRLEESFEAEKRFSNDASHELRTPISVILAQCEYSLAKDRKAKEMKSALALIFDQSKKMSDLISKIMILARADNAKQSLEFEKLNLSELIELVVVQHEELAQQKHITLMRDIEADIYITADQTMLIRLYMNLITNGIYYGKEQGFVKVMLKKEKKHIVSQVIDNGIGISDENLPKIWNRFYQVNPSRDSSRSGLGLSMVQWIAEAHGGDIRVESKIDEGTTFTIKF